MFVENLDDLPESLREQFVESEYNGKKGFQHKETVALVNAMKNAKTEKDTYRSELEQIKSKLSDFEKAKADEIEKAKAEALEQARSKGDVAAIEERYQQQMEDLKKRSEEESNTYKSQLEALQNSIKSEKRNAMVADLASELATSTASKAFKALLANRIDVDPATGKATFLDENGGATSLDLEGFKKEIQKDELFAPLLKSGVVTQGGGNVNGSGSGAGANRKFNEYSSQELVALRKSDPSTYERLRNEYYN